MQPCQAYCVGAFLNPRTNHDLKLRNHPGFKGVWNYCKWCSRKQIKLLNPQIFHHSFPKNDRASHPCRTVGSWLSSGAKWIRRDPGWRSVWAADVFDAIHGPTGQAWPLQLSVLADHGTERKGPLGAQEETNHWGRLVWEVGNHSEC